MIAERLKLNWWIVNYTHVIDVIISLGCLFIINSRKLFPKMIILYGLIFNLRTPNGIIEMNIERACDHSLEERKREQTRHGPLTRYVKLRVAHAPGMPRKFPPRRRIQRKPLVNDPGMHRGTCVTHVPWCISESLTRGGGENVPGIPGACAPAILLIWQEAHARDWNHYRTAPPSCRKRLER